MSDLVVAITGASGSIYAVRLLDALLSLGRNVHLTVSPAACQVIKHELGLSIDLASLDESDLLPPDADLVHDSRLGVRRVSGSSGLGNSSVFSESESSRGRLTYHHYMDFSAGIASGSFLTDGMVICPCSMGTLASIAHGQSSNLIQRAADVHLKERRKLIVVPRETPLGSIQLDNMKRLTDAGAVVLPAMPGFYHNPTSIQDLVDFVVGRICDQLGVRHALFKRWGGQNATEDA
ncbi:MAG: UbiX family flavin prenyltransferase [Planctomycetaceae bacterium]|nr:UbiX family flavin prenyltransferase [Planctomycetaceae bacterium]